MTVRVTCPNPDCQAIANVEEQSLGKRGRCKKCGQVFALARPNGEPASMISGDASAWKKGSNPARPTELPEQFGRYRIMKQLGQGGMGAVYLALDTKLDRQVALKVPYFHPSEGPQAVQRFEREARAAATLDHPNLCPIHDVGESDGIHYLTMPYIQGKTLADALSKDQTFTEPQAAAVVRKLALALQEAHEKGIIHRDLKPGNIMINRRREMIIMDFGLARMAGGDEAITRTGNVLGTALYMAPEQAAGDVNAIGPACDVYSLGVILHELLTGRRPFEGPWSLVIGLKNIKDPDPPSQFRPGLSPGIEAICLKSIAKDRNDRYQTMGEFAEALGFYLARSTPQGPTPAKSVTIDALNPAFDVPSRGETTPLQEETSEGSGERLPQRTGLIWMIAVGATVLVSLGVMINTVIGHGRTQTQADDPSPTVKKELPAIPNEEPSDLGDLGPKKIIEQTKPLDDEHRDIPDDLTQRVASTWNDKDWSSSKEGLLVDNEEGFSMIYFGNPAWKDYDYSFQVKKLNDREGGFSSLFHVVDLKNYLAFRHGVGRRSAGTLLSEGCHYINGKWTITTNQVRDITINRNRWYAVNVKIRGSHVTIRLDGVKVFDYEDDSIESGQVGIQTHEGVNMLFRDFLVVSPDGKVLWRGLPLKDKRPFEAIFE